MVLSDFKGVVVGDATVGKTSLLLTYTTGQFPAEYIPTTAHDFGGSATINGKTYTIALYDTAAQEDYDRLRPLAYPGTDVFLICFSVASPPSLRSVRDKWLPELRRFVSRDIPFLLVGTKVDLRDDPQTIKDLASREMQPVSWEEGERVARKLSAVKYVECSALEQVNLKEVFDEAIVAAVEAPREKKKHHKDRSCLLL
ncbi:Rho family small GTPase [Aspergillus lucknowensis]|uniref:Cell division control protein 42 n=1 Tax=Aspergillus lucknowensis TaxID=176173 RepID=A0ABR4LQW9_9EURO